MRKDFAAKRSFLLWQLRAVSYSVGCSVNIFFSERIK